MGKPFLKRRSSKSVDSSTESEPIEEQTQDQTLDDGCEQPSATKTVEKIVEPQRLEKDDIKEVLRHLERLVGNDLVLSDLCQTMKDYLRLQDEASSSQNDASSDDDTVTRSASEEETFTARTAESSPTEVPTSSSESVPYEEEIIEIASNDKFEAIRKINQLKREGNLNEEEFQYLKNIIRNQ